MLLANTLMLKKQERYSMQGSSQSVSVVLHIDHPYFYSNSLGCGVKNVLKPQICLDLKTTIPFNFFLARILQWIAKILPCELQLWLQYK